MNVSCLSVVGLGKLGLTMAACFSRCGYKVTGVELNPWIVSEVNARRSPIFEPGVSEILSASEQSLTATHDMRLAVEGSDVTFIVVPTPSQPDGAFSTHYAEDALRGIATHLKGKKGYHLIVLTSTVLPGATAGLQQLLERESGKKCGQDFGLCYSPEFIALGNVIKGLTEPDLVLIGEYDKRSGDILSQIYQRVCTNHPPVVRTSFVNAELGKILLNSYVTMKISFANSVGELCEGVAGADAGEVSRILGLDSRIGMKYLSAGLGFGGPCFPRDNRAVGHVARNAGVEAILPTATDNVNKRQNARLVDLIEARTGGVSGKKISILGITYKPSTDVIEESAVMAIVKGLLVKGARVCIFDPAGIKNARAALGEDAEYAASIEQCLSGSEFCLLGTPWPEFKVLSPETFTRCMKHPALLDCWRVFDRSLFSDKLDYFAVGLNSPRVKERAGRQE